MLQLGKISSDDLNIFLNFYPRLEQEFTEAREMIPENYEQIFGAHLIKPDTRHYARTG